MGTPIRASEVDNDLGGCIHHTRFRLGCDLCKANRDELLESNTARIDAYLNSERAKIDALLVEEYEAGLDTWPF